MVRPMPTPKGKARAKKPSGTPRRRRGVKLRPTELGATELALEAPPAELAALAEAIRADGGAVLATYREPLGGHALLLAALPIEQGRADAVPARHLRRARAPADAGDGQDQALPRSDHRRARADRERGLLDAERLSPPDGAQGAGRQDGAGAARARARGRLPDPGAQHREGAQPAREGDRRAAHVPRSGRGPGRQGGRDRLRARVRGAGAGDARLRLRGARAPLGRRLPLDPAQGRQVAARPARRRD